MPNGTDGPTTADDLIARATETVRARHVVALCLEVPDDAVAADLAGTASRALRRLPARGPLRRQKDRRLLKAIRILVDDLPDGDSSRKSLRWAMEEAEWRARLGRR
jgi:hypothetical protein